jgi:hypothetical protein
VLTALRYADADPALAVAIAHFVELVQTYAAALANLAGRRSPGVEEKLQPFVFQWSPKNVMKFVHTAASVAASRRGLLGEADGTPQPFEVDQALLTEAVSLLNKSGAFTWTSRDDAAMSLADERRIHCPAQAFLHKVIVNQGSLMTVLAFVRAELRRSPVAPELQASVAFVRATATREAEAVRRHGAAWSEMALHGAHG